MIAKTGGTEVSQTVHVGGDPEMNISIDQWRQRERFLLSVSKLQCQIWDDEQRLGALDKSFSSTHDSLESMDEVDAEKLEWFKTWSDTAKVRLRRVRGLRNRIYRMAASFNGLGVRLGSLYPPTQTHIHIKKRLQKRLEEERQGLKELEVWAKEEKIGIPRKGS